MQTSDFRIPGTECAAHNNIIVQEVEVHGWLLSSFFSKRFGARLSHSLNRKFVRTDDTTQDSEETATRGVTRNVRGRRHPGASALRNFGLETTPTN